MDFGLGILFLFHDGGSFRFYREDLVMVGLVFTHSRDFDNILTLGYCRAG